MGHRVFTWRPALLLALGMFLLGVIQTASQVKLLELGPERFEPEEPYLEWEKRHYSTSSAQAVLDPTWKSSNPVSQPAQESELEQWLRGKMSPAEYKQHANAMEELSRRKVAFQNSPEYAQWFTQRKTVRPYTYLTAANIGYCLGVSLLAGLIVYGVTIGQRWSFTFPHKGWKRLALCASPLFALFTLFIASRQQHEWEYEARWLLTAAALLVAAPIVLLLREVALWVSRGFRES